jgi:hypothetical protein
VGDRLAATVPRALAHLQTKDRPVQPDELTIELWDERATGIGCEGCVIGDDLEVPGNTDVSPRGRYVTVTRAQTRTCFDRIGQRMVGWIGDVDRLTQYEIGRPLHSELLLWHRDRGLQALHAGLVGKEGDAVLLGGPGGSGKSTTALTCLMAGLAYLADDYVALGHEGERGVVGHSVYCSTHVEPKHLERFPALRPHAIPGRLAREDKSLVLLSDLPWAVLPPSARIRALAFPRVVDAPRTTFRPASRAQALMRLAPSSLMLLPFPGLLGPRFEQLASLVQELPVFWLDLGRDLEQIPSVIGALLDEVAG